MKLVPLILIIIGVKVYAAYGQLTFPPHFRDQSPGKFSSENSLYLPPESHTATPYFSMKDFKNLPFPYLPSSNKGHPMFSTPFPFMVTSTLIPSDDIEEEDDDKNTNLREGTKSTVKPRQWIRNFNRTERITMAPDVEREVRPIPKNFKFGQQVDRKDLKPFPFAPNNLPNTMKNTVTQTASPRSLIISPENNKVDQIKSGSFLAPQYFTSPGLFVSSTVEPAIPIIRLSNEMDLDGSFSYEALGADQTHYVQHSRMENFGTDKQEQVVEGSYSYVGDNGQTYTVHYIADSNGFRATGEHLPVAPPIPEIIQRAIQHNLAEEARNPSIHKNSWEYGNIENEISESEKVHRFAFSPPHNLFTGKTPESFSRGFAQSFNKENNLLDAASANTVKTVDFTSDQTKSKMNTETISPQITFVASQGAHVPSVNKAQQQSQQIIARTFTTDKPTLPQLMNYEKAVKDAEQENNRALWRWQYGLNAENNQSPNKNSISRSSNDDVIINFNDMSPEQYSQMIKTEIQNDNNNASQDNTNNRAPINEYQNIPSQHSTSSSVSTTQYENRDKYTSNLENKRYTEKSHNPNKQVRSDARAKLITLNEFLPPSQIVTQSYDYIDSYGARKTKSVEEDINNLNVIPLSRTDKPSENWSETYSFDNSRSSPNMYQESFKSSTLPSPRFTDFIIQENDDHNFKSLISTTTEDFQEPTTEATLEDSLKNNLFLENIFNSNSEMTNTSNTYNNDLKEYNLQPKLNSETKSNRTIKYFAAQARPFEESKGLTKSPMDMADIIRFMSMKSNFESNKIRPRFRPEHTEGQKNERSIPVFDQQDNVPKNEKSYGNWNHQPEELRGLIKNYKVLQRKNHGYNNEERMDHLRRISPLVPGNMQSPVLPPLGRAGPSIKSYLPPIYV